MHTRAHRRFRRTVCIDEPSAFRPPADQLSRTGFSGNNQGTQRVHPRFQRQHSQRRRRQCHVRNLPCTQCFQQRFPRQQLFRGRQVKTGSATQRHHHLRYARIKTERGELQHLAACLHSKRLSLRSSQV